MLDLLGGSCMNSDEVNEVKIELLVQRCLVGLCATWLLVELLEQPWNMI